MHIIKNTTDISALHQTDVTELLCVADARYQDASDACGEVPRGAALPWASSLRVLRAQERCLAA